jgi:outer membrane protein OmpA-like peptidoglycan-associated protein
MLDADPAELAGSLKAAGVLPSLTGATVVFSGLGDTAAPQQALGAPQRANLVDIWTAIAKAAGAAEVTVDQSPLSGASAEGLPPVKTVPVGAGVNCTATSVTLSGGDVSFKPDSAELADRTAALARLQPLADQMVREGLSAKLTGSTARVGDEVGQRQLSQQRAEAVRQLLVDLGVPAERMTAVGVGSEFDAYVADHDAAGQLIPAAAAANRKVVLDLSGASTAIACS